MQRRGKTLSCSHHLVKRFSRAPDNMTPSISSSELDAGFTTHLTALSTHASPGAKSPRLSTRALAIISLTMSYFHTGTRTIIGAESFHCPVRDGKEWDQLAMVIRLNRWPGCCSSSAVRRCWGQPWHEMDSCRGTNEFVESSCTPFQVCTAVNQLMIVSVCLQ